MKVKGMIFAAGIGSRLRPITDVMPKAMVDVGGKPMLRRVIDKFVGAGISEIVVNVHHFADMIVDYLTKECGDCGATLLVSDERDLLLDTGGGLLAAAPLLKDADAIVIHNADILSDSSIDLLVAYHAYRGGIATLMTDPMRESSRRLLFDSDLRLHGRLNISSGKTTPAGLDSEAYQKAAFSGIHVVDPGIFQELKDYSRHIDTTIFSITDFYAERCENLPIYGYVAERPSTWFDVGRPEALEKARALFTPQV